MACFVEYIAHQGMSITFDQAMSFTQHAINYKHLQYRVVTQELLWGFLLPFQKCRLSQQTRQSEVWSQSLAYDLSRTSLPEWHVFLPMLAPLWLLSRMAYQLLSGAMVYLLIKSLAHVMNRRRKEGSKSTPSYHRINSISIRLMLQLAQSHTDIFTDGAEEFQKGILI